MLGDLFYRLGAITGEADARLRGKAGAAGTGGAREVAVYDADGDDAGGAGNGVEDTVESAAIAAAATWLLARVFRPRPVSWPRVVLAGIAATALADLIGRTVEDEGAPGNEPHATDAEELLGRLGAGIAVAAGYAALLYPRIPGSPLFRGLVFGALEIVAAPRGGLVHLAASAPGVKFPLQALALPVDEDAGPLSHLAFGVGLGLFYRYAEAGEED